MIAIVTGASSGIGKEFVRQITSHYKNINEIWVIARRTERLKTLQKMVNVKLVPITLDLINPDSIKVLKKMLKERSPKVKLLVNSAGFGQVGGFTDMDCKYSTDMIALNCTALTAITHTVLPYITYNGRIIQIASSAAFLPQPDFAVYAATKSYVLSFSRALNVELKRRKIKVTAVCPGPVKTEFFDLAEKTGKLAEYKKYFFVDAVKVVRKALIDSVDGKELSIYSIPMKAFYILTKTVPHRIILKIYK